MHITSSLRALLALLLAMPMARGATPYILASVTAAKETNAFLCTLSWNALPPEFEVIHYSVYQAERVEGPYTLIANTDTNSFEFIVEQGTHFWNVKAISVWNGAAIPSESPASKSVGMLESMPGGMKVKPSKPPHKMALPDALLIPLQAPPLMTPLEPAFTRARPIPTRVPPVTTNTPRVNPN